MARELKASFNQVIAGRTFVLTKSNNQKQFVIQNNGKIPQRRKTNYLKDPDKYRERAKRYNAELSRKERGRYLRNRQRKQIQ